MGALLAGSEYSSTEKNSGAVIVWLKARGESGGRGSGACVPSLLPSLHITSPVNVGHLQPASLFALHDQTPKAREWDPPQPTQCEKWLVCL